MANKVGRILSTVFVLAWVVVPVLSQSLSARVKPLQPQPAVVSGDSDRVRDGLVGPVRRVRTELVRVSNTRGAMVEEQRRTLLETAEYDLKGRKTQNQYFSNTGSTLTGREVYKYDDKGNISEMTMMGPDGTLIGKEVYKYEFDSVGNWIKMTTSVAVVEDGKVNFEPTEFTYRAIFYYLDEKMARMLEPAPSAPAPVESAERGDTRVQSTNFAGVDSGDSERDIPRPNESAPKRDNPVQTSAAQLPSPRTLDISKISLSQPVPPESRAANTQPLVVLATEPPVNLASESALKPISRGVLNGVALHLPTPVYPDAARRMRTAGLVVVEVTIDENGKVVSANAVSGPGLLRGFAVQAAYRARFSPTKLSGQPVKVTGTINYKFTLTP